MTDGVSEAENAQLAESLETRKVADRAKGICNAISGSLRMKLTERCSERSRQRRKSMREIAEAILLGGGLKKGQVMEGRKSVHKE